VWQDIPAGDSNSLSGCVSHNRVAAAAPSGYICGYRRLLETIGPQDGEQIFLHGISRGIDHADLIEVFCTKSHISSSARRGIFSVFRVARETFQEVSRTYAAIRKKRIIWEMVEDDFEHGYTKKKSGKRFITFFLEIFNLPGDPAEEELEPLSADELKITATGNVNSSLKGRRFQDSTGMKHKNWFRSWTTSRKNVDAHYIRLKIQAKELSGFVAPSEVDDSVFRGRYQRDGYSWERYVIRGEGNYVIPLLLYIPNSNAKHLAMIYLHPDGKTSGDSAGGWIEQLVKKEGVLVAAPNSSSEIGETQKWPPNYPDDPCPMLSSSPEVLSASMRATSSGLRNFLKIERMSMQAGSMPWLLMNYVRHCWHAAAFWFIDQPNGIAQGSGLLCGNCHYNRLYHYSLSFSMGSCRCTRSLWSNRISPVASLREDCCLAELKDCMRKERHPQNS